MLLALALAAAQAASPAAPEAASPAPDARPKVVMETSLGRIRIALEPDKAPATVKNFLAYVRAGHYDGTIFHRVIPRFMAQGGGMDAQMKERDTRAPIKNESANGLSNRRGTLAMARTSDPDSATDQFFVNVVDNGRLDARGGQPGYAVFGEVVEGMDVVDRMVAVPTTNRGPHANVPVTPVVIKSARVEGDAAAPKKVAPGGTRRRASPAPSPSAP